MAWQSMGTSPVPGWMRLTDDHIDTVIGWINTDRWAESRQYFGENSGRLLADTTPTVLSELALTAPENLISLHRNLLDAIGEHGLRCHLPAAAGDETLREWIAAPGWQASRAFLHDHLQLLGQDIPALLANLTNRPDSAITSTGPC